MKNPTITYVKAIGIILMVLAHSNSLLWIDYPIGMFHMPLFFIVSGFCLKEKYFDIPHIFIWRKIKKLWWLFVKYSLLFIALHNVFYRLHIYDGHFWNQHYYGTNDFVMEIKNVFIHMLNHELLLRQFWFIKTLFFASIIAFIVLYFSKMLKKHFGLTDSTDRIMYIVILIVGGLSVLCLNVMHRTFTFFYISPRELLGAVFFLCGYFLSQIKAKKISMSVIILCVIILVINSFYFHLRMKSDFYDTGKILPYAMTAILMTWSIYSLPWNKLNGRVAHYLQYIGENTLPILIWHFLCFKIVSLVICFNYRLPIYEIGAFHVIYQYANQGWFILYTAAGILIPLTVQISTEKIFKSVNLYLSK